MTGVDSNILIYAHRRDSPWNAAAKDVMRRLAEGSESWAIPWQCIYEFLAVTTHPRVYSPPSSLRQAIQQVEY